MIVLKVPKYRFRKLDHLCANCTSLNLISSGSILQMKMSYLCSTASSVRIFTPKLIFYDCRCSHIDRQIYTHKQGVGATPKSDEMFTTVRRSPLLSGNSLRKWEVRRSAAVTFSIQYSWRFSTSAGTSCRTYREESHAFPALLMSNACWKSVGSTFWVISSSALWNVAWLVRSADTTWIRTSGAAAWTRRRVSSRRPVFRAVRTSKDPLVNFSARPIAMARPIPWLAPVTTQTDFTLRIEEDEDEAILLSIQYWTTCICYIRSYTLPCRNKFNIVISTAYSPRTYMECRLLSLWIATKQQTIYLRAGLNTEERLHCACPMCFIEQGIQI